MIQLSMWTVIFSHVISSSINMLVMTLLWLQNRRRFSETGFWLANAVMQFVAVLLIAMRGNIPDFASIVLGNALIALGILLLYMGLEKFVGLQTSQLHNYILLVIFVLIHSFFTFVQPSLLARNINVSLILILFSCQAAWSMFRRVTIEERSITRSIGFIACAYAVINLTRIILDLISPPGDDFFNSNPNDTLIILSSQMLFIILTFGLILMVNRRLVKNLEQDITERKQAEETLRERDALYRQMFTDHTAVMLLIEPDSGQIVEANPAAATFYGYPVEVLQQMNIEQINKLPPEKVGKDRRAAAAGDQNYFVFSHRLASKEIRDVEVHSVPIQIRGNTLLYSIIHDITERKHAEDALLESEEKFHTAFHASPVVMAISTLEGGMFIDANTQFFKLTGYERNEVLGKMSTDLGLWSDEARQSIKEELKEYGYAHHKEVNLITQSGETVPILWFGDVVHIDNMPCLISSGYDLREQRQAEQALRESEAFSQAVLKNSPIGISVRSRTGKLLSANDAWKRIWAIPESEVLEDREQERETLEFNARDDYLLQHQAEIRHVYETGGYLHLPELKTTHPRPGGAEWVSQHFYALMDENGTVNRVIILTEDITERKRAEKELEESEHKHRTMIANISDVVAIMDKNGIIQYKSPNIEKHFGWQPEDLVGTNGWDTVHPDDLNRIQKEFFNLLEEENAIKKVEYRYKRKDGGYSLIELTATNLTHDSQINGVLMNYHDITNRKHVEDELIRQKSFFEQTFIQSATSTQILDQEGWCLRINPKLSELFGVKSEHIEGHVYNIFEDEEIKRHGIDTILKKVYEDRKVEKWEVHFDIGVAADSQNIEVEQKKKVWYANKAYPIIDSKGDVTNVIVQHEDITERKQAEQAVQDALLEKEVLLRELYHRAKNNMQVISSMLNLEIAQSEDERLIKTLKDTDNRIRSMALVHQKLYQSQNLSSIDLKDYIPDLVSLMIESYQVVSGHINFSLQIQSIPVLIDTAIPCGLIINEILSNTLKYAFPGNRKGNIRICVERDKDATIILDISDDGVGVPADKDLHNSNTLGMQTIFGIARHQLGAKVELDIHQGVAWHIQFTDDLYTSRI